MAKKQPDLFEKAFGKAPKKGYKFNYVNYQFGWRSIVINWSCAGIGFGELALIFTDKGLEIDSECMSLEFVESTLKKVLKCIKKGQKAITWEPSPTNPKIQHMVASKENHEKFIEAVCLTFLHYIQNKPNDIQIR